MMDKNCLYCKSEFDSFEERVAQILRMGWAVQKGSVDRNGFEKNVLNNIISTMGFEHKEHLRWVAENAEWRRYDFPSLTEDSLVIDAGGFDGKWAEEIYNKYKCNIIIFEPIQSFYEEIVERFKDNKKVRVWPYGLSDEGKIEVMHLQSNSSSVFATDGIEEEVQMFDFNNWLEENQIKNIDLLKFNVEGGEYKVLMSMTKSESHLLVDEFLIQFHRFPEYYDSMYDAIHNEFKKSHDVVWNYSFVWEKLKRKK
jgi:FkbM family methyltransferase